MVTTAALSPSLGLSGPGTEFVSHEHLSREVQVSGEKGCLGTASEEQTQDCPS